MEGFTKSNFPLTNWDGNYELLKGPKIASTRRSEICKGWFAA
jgi:hypothetical protein